jgi:DNA-binding GntR family transcriptional regulator
MVQRQRSWHPPHIYGDNNPRTKIKSRLRKRIRIIKQKTGFSERTLAQIFGISRASIHNALNEQDQI